MFLSLFPFFLPAFLVNSLHCLHSSLPRFLVCLFVPILLPSFLPSCLPSFLPSFLISFFLSFLPFFFPLSLPSFLPLLWFYFFLAARKSLSSKSLSLNIRKCVFDTCPAFAWFFCRGIRRFALYMANICWRDGRRGKHSIFSAKGKLVVRVPVVWDSFLSCLYDSGIEFASESTGTKAPIYPYIVEKRNCPIPQGQWSTIWA